MDVLNVCCEEWKSKYTKLETTRGNVQKNALFLKEKIIGTSSLINQYREAKETIRKHDEEVAEQKRINNMLSAQLAAEKQETANMRLQIEQMFESNKPTLLDLEQFKASLEKKTRKAKSRKAYIRQLEATVKEGKEARENFSTVQKEATRLHKEFSSKESQYKDLLKKNKQNQAQINTLNAEIEKLQASLEQANSTILSLELEGSISKKDTGDNIDWECVEPVGSITDYSKDLEGMLETCTEFPATQKLDKSMARIAAKEPTIDNNTFPPLKRSTAENRIHTPRDDEVVFVASSPEVPVLTPPPSLPVKPTAESSRRRRRAPEHKDALSPPVVPAVPLFLSKFAAAVASQSNRAAVSPQTSSSAISPKKVTPTVSPASPPSTASVTPSSLCPIPITNRASLPRPQSPPTLPPPATFPSQPTPSKKATKPITKPIAKPIAKSITKPVEATKPSEPEVEIVMQQQEEHVEWEDTGGWEPPTSMEEDRVDEAQQQTELFEQTLVEEKEAKDREQKERAAREAEEQKAREIAVKEVLEREAKEKEAKESETREKIRARAARTKEARERAAREKAEREAKEREAREIAEREAKEHEAREKAEREAKEREAREKAAREAKEREAREKAEREAKEREAREKAEREAKEREAREKAAREAKEKAAREAKEKAEREAKEKQAREQEAREKEARERATREREAKAAQAKAERERIAKEENEKLERERVARELETREIEARVQAALKEAEKEAREALARETREKEARETEARAKEAQLAAALLEKQATELMAIELVSQSSSQSAIEGASEGGSDCSDMNDAASPVSYGGDDAASMYSTAPSQTNDDVSSTYNDDVSSTLSRGDDMASNVSGMDDNTSTCSTASFVSQVEGDEVEWEEVDEEEGRILADVKQEALDRSPNTFPVPSPPAVSLSPTNSLPISPVSSPPLAVPTQNNKMKELLQKHKRQVKRSTLTTTQKYKSKIEKLEAHNEHYIAQRKGSLASPAISPVISPSISPSINVSQPNEKRKREDLGAGTDAHKKICLEEEEDSELKEVVELVEDTSISCAQHPIVSSFILGISQSVELEPPLSPSHLPEDPQESVWEVNKDLLPMEPLYNYLCRRFSLVFSSNPAYSLSSMYSCDDLVSDFASILSHNLDTVVNAFLKVLHDCNSKSKVGTAVNLFWQFFMASNNKGTELRNLCLHFVHRDIVMAQSFLPTFYLCEFYARICKSNNDMDKVLYLAYEVIRQNALWKTQILCELAQWWPDPFIAKSENNKLLLLAMETIVAVSSVDQSNPMFRKEQEAYELLRKTCYWPYRSKPEAALVEGLIPDLIQGLVQSVEEPVEERALFPLRTNVLFKTFELIALHKGSDWTYNDLLMKLWAIMSPQQTSTGSNIIPAVVRLIGKLSVALRPEAIEAMRTKLGMILKPSSVERFKFSFLTQTCAAMSLADLSGGDKRRTTACRTWYASLPHEKKCEIAIHQLLMDHCTN